MPNRERSSLLIEHVDRRRIGIEQAMWQAPALTVAAQAFLLRVLTDRGVDGTARLVILLAGIAAVLAAVFSLVRLRSREVLYSDAISRYFADLGMPDPRPRNLPRKRLETGPKSWSEQVDGWLQDRAQRWPFPMYLLWCIALLLFAAADVVAFAATI